MIIYYEYYVATVEKQNKTKAKREFKKDVRVQGGLFFPLQRKEEFILNLTAGSFCSWCDFLECLSLLG